MSHDKTAVMQGEVMLQGPRVVNSAIADMQSRLDSSTSLGRDSRLHGNDERSDRLSTAWE
jgi:hypothetical protein